MILNDNQPMTPDYWQNALNHLRQQDKRLAQLIEQYPDLLLEGRGDAFLTLVRAVVGQQISVKAADSVWQKVMKRFRGQLNYQVIADITVNELRACGLSAQKAGYLINIARYFYDNNIDVDYWQKFNYDSIYKALIGIKGVGKWTIEMFAIFYLLEPDIFPKKDLGLIRAIEKLYQQPKNTITPQQMDKISKKWQPYRTVATWYLWRSVDTDVVIY